MKRLPLAASILAIAVAVAGCATAVPFRASRPLEPLPREQARSRLELLLSTAARPRPVSWDWTTENDPLENVKVGDDGFAFLAAIPVRRTGNFAHAMVRVDREYSFDAIDPHAYLADGAANDVNVVVSLKGSLSGGGQGGEGDPRTDCIWFRRGEDAELFIEALQSLIR